MHHSDRNIEKQSHEVSKSQKDSDQQNGFENDTEKKYNRKMKKYPTKSDEYSDIEEIFQFYFITFGFYGDKVSHLILIFQVFCILYQENTFFAKPIPFL